MERAQGSCRYPTADGSGSGSTAGGHQLRGGLGIDAQLIGGDAASPDVYFVFLNMKS